MAEIAKLRSDTYSMAEFLAVIMSRALAENDGEVGGVGAAATIPMAAVRLATLTVAPNIYWFCGSSGAFNPSFDHLPMTSADPRAFYGCEATQKMQDIVDMGGRGDWGFGFSGGMQIDRHGNANLIGIGPYDNMTVRGPGTVGLAWSRRIRTSHLFTWHHNRSVFVEQVDHVSGPGWNPDAKAAGLQTRGPRQVFTPLCIMDFGGEGCSMRLVSVHPGYSSEDVIAHTGFDLDIPERIPETPEPTDHELFLLRNLVDRGGVLKTLRLSVG